MIGDVSRTRTVLAVILLSALALSGCTDGDPQPKFAPPESSAPTSPATSAPTASSADSVRAQQADLIERFVGAISQSLKTGNPAPFLVLTSDTCQNCRVLADNLAEAYSGGGHIEGGKWLLRASDYQGEKPLGSIWNIDIQSSREQWFNGAGEVVKIVRAGPQRFGAALEQSADGWRVRELRLRG